MSDPRVEFYPKKSVDGTLGWYWINTDDGAWEGPASDWPNHWAEIDRRLPADRRRVVVQAGGCQGMYPKLLAKRFGQVYTFEPDHLNFDALVANVDEKNVIKMQAALGETVGFVTVKNMNMKNTGTHTVSEGGLVPRLTVDVLGLSPDFIWLDVEGYEINVLRGAVETIDRCSPLVMCERPNKDTDDLLGSMGYVMDCRSMADGIYVRTGSTRG